MLVRKHAPIANSCDGIDCGPDCPLTKFADGPSFLQKIGNFAKAAGEHVMAGLPMLAPEQKALRLSICERCDQFDQSNPNWRVCKQCGCSMDLKAGWAEQTCPLGKWPDSPKATAALNGVHKGRRRHDLGMGRFTYVDPPLGLNLEGDIIQVQCSSNGIGDQMMALQVAEGLHIQWAKTAVLAIAPEHTHQWIELFKFHPLTVPIDAPLVFCDHSNVRGVYADFVQQGKSPTEYWSEQAATTPILPEPKPIEPIGGDYVGSILIAPLATCDARTWPMDKWVELERRLIERGQKCVILHSEGDGRLDALKSEKWFGRPAQHVASLMRSCGALASNDSGMAHVAGMLRVPVAAICVRVSYPNVFGIYPTVRTLDARWRGQEAVTPGEMEAALLGMLDKSGRT